MITTEVYDAGYEAAIDSLIHDIYDLQDENAKLRELVSDIWDAYRCEEVAPNVAKHWHDRMRELGIEVGE